MAEFSNLQLTNDGETLMAKILAGLSDVKFTNVSSSTTVYEESEIEGLTELTNIKQTVGISDIIVVNEKEVQIDAVMNNRELTEDYTLRAVGVYAEDPDKGEILYGVALETTGTYIISAYNGVTVYSAYFQFITEVGNAENVSLDVEESVYALKDYVDYEISVIRSQMLTVEYDADNEALVFTKGI